MPVKGNKKTTKRPSRKTSRVAIKKLVKDIPQLMHDAGYFSENNDSVAPTAAPTPIHGQPLPSIETMRERRRWLWVGVTLFMLAIIIPWSINIKTKFYDAHRTIDQGDTILANSKHDLEVVFNSMRDSTGAPPTSTSSTTEIIKNQLKNILAPLVNQTSTTSVTSSTATPTTTLIVTTTNHLSVSSTTSTR